MPMRQTAILLLMLLMAGCASTRIVHLHTGPGRPLEYMPRAQSGSVQVTDDEFRQALAFLVLDVPLALRAPDAGSLVRTSSFSTLDRALQGALRKDYGRWCHAHEGPRDCLSLLDDGLGFSATDRLAVALGMSLDPMHASMAEAVAATVSPAFFKAVVVSALVSWVVLAANPEPVFTKAAAVLAAVVVGYLGIDAFMAVVQACRELKAATDRATTFQELDEAGERFGQAVGPQAARLFVLATTALVSRGTTGGAAWLAARLSQLPRFAEAAALGAAQVGLRLEAVGEVSGVAVVDGQLAFTLAPTAVAMAVQGPRGASPVPANGASRGGFVSFDAFKNAMGPAGPNRNWHHIVEQTPGNVQRFGPRALHNTDNVIAIDAAVHQRISGLYSSIRPFSRGMTVRRWLSTQSFEAQREFGLKVLRDFGVIS